ncbi:MAG: hypothetical protein ACP5JK_03065 [Candidatus Aenigmatarchaeota archaeon]
MDGVLIFKAEKVSDTEKLSKEEFLRELKILWDLTRDEILVLTASGIGRYRHDIDMDSMEIVKLLDTWKKE